MMPFHDILSTVETMETNSNCRKFEANMFNKAKCQNCFRQKDEHTSMALEHLRNARKISKCAYLFVAPESFDFSNSLDRTRRWQRRFFILYDDGELTYSVDENIETIPQGTVDMNTCTEVASAEDVTGHQYSIAINTQSAVIYVKGGSREEINRWQDILSIFTNGGKIKTKKVYEKSFSQPAEICERLADNLLGGSNVSIQPLTSSVIKTSPALAHGADSSYLLTTNITIPNTSTSSASLPCERPVPSTCRQSSVVVSEQNPSAFRGIRSLKHKNDRSLLSGGSFDVHLRKTSSLQDVTDGSTVAVVDTASSVQGSSVSLTDDESLHGLIPSFDACSSCMYDNRSNVTSQGGTNCSGKETSGCVDHFVQRRARGPRRRATTALELEQVGRTCIVSNTAQFWKELLSENSSRKHERNNADEGVRIRHSSVDTRRRSRRDALSPRFLTIGCSPRETRMNETDERKMAKSGDIVSIERPKSVGNVATLTSVDYKDTDYIKKGWLLQRVGEKDWLRRWCVLNARSLSIYQDTSDELSDSACSALEMLSSTNVEDGDAGNHFTFQIKTNTSKLVLAAASHGIRQLWKDAIIGCISRLSPEQRDETITTATDDSSDDGTSIASDITCDNTLVELLETEVASLKRQLEFSQTQLVEFQKVNSNLRQQIHVSGVDRRSELSEEMAIDQVRYQLEKIENESAYIQDKCGKKEQEKLQIQVKNMKRKLHQALKTAKSQKKEIESLQSQLTISVSKSRATLEAMLAQASREAKEERDKLEFDIRRCEKQKNDLERKESELLTEVKRFEKKLETALSRAQNLRVELDMKNASIDKLVNEREHLILQHRENINAYQQQLSNSLDKLKLKEAEDTCLKRDNTALKSEISSLNQELANQRGLILGLKENSKQLAEDRNRLAAQLSGQSILTLSLTPLSSSSSFSSVSPVSSTSAAELESVDEVESSIRMPECRLHAGVLELESQMDRLLSVGLTQDSSTAKIFDDSQLSIDSHVADLERRLRDVQADYEQELELQRAAHKRELSRTRDEMMQLLSSVESGRMPGNEELMGHKYMKEVEHIKEVFDRGFRAMEKSHQATLDELKKTHSQELERLQKERNDLLQAEAQDTQAALKAMKKAHEIELENERSKYRELMSRTSAISNAESLHKKHGEICDLSEQYSIKCLESAALQNQLEDRHLRIRDLITRNDDLSVRLKNDVDKLGRVIDDRLSQLGSMSSTRDDGSTRQVNLLKSSLDLKNLELARLRNDLTKVEHQLKLTQDTSSDNAVNVMKVIGL